MNFKLISAACLAVCSSGAFAAVSSCPATPTAADLVNKCAPEVTLYIAGASAQQPALVSVITTPEVLFDANKPFVKVRDVASTVSGKGTTFVLDATKAQSDGNSFGYIGYGATDTAAAGKRLFVLYNKANGSAAGVAQLLSGGKMGTGDGEEITLATTTAKEQATATGKATACFIDVASPGSPTFASPAVYNCTTELPFSSGWGLGKEKAPALALSDVRPNELSPLLPTAVYKLMSGWKASAFPNTVTGVQGFGVIVNPKLYSALIAREVAAGRLDSSCNTSQTVGSATDVITQACAPSISKAEYASIITGKLTKLSDLGISATGQLNLARRVDGSGTQASSNIFFANQAGFNVKTPMTDLFPDLVGNSGTAKASTLVANDLYVSTNSGTGDVITAISGDTTNYAIGVVSIENVYSMTKSASKLKGALFLKVDGLHPSFDATGAIDPKHRFALQSGYPFAFEMQALVSAKSADPVKSLADKVIAAVKSPTYNLAGIAYIGSTDTAKNTTFTRQGFNYGILSK